MLQERNRTKKQNFKWKIMREQPMFNTNKNSANKPCTWEQPSRFVYNYENDKDAKINLVKLDNSDTSYSSSSSGLCPHLF